jgi:hypothetical protein
MLIAFKKDFSKLLNSLTGACTWILAFQILF